MNGKFEEKLAELAFGDLSPEDAKRIEAQAMADPASPPMAMRSVLMPEKSSAAPSQSTCTSLVMRVAG